MDQTFQEKDILSPDPLGGTDSPEEAGELAIDVFEDDGSIIVQAPMAGVKAEDLDLSITDDTVTIKGSRQTEHLERKTNHLVEECFWGAFERTYTLPVTVDSEKARASLKNGLLTITIPKAQKSKTKVIEINQEG